MLCYLYAIYMLFAKMFVHMFYFNVSVGSALYTLVFVAKVTDKIGMEI